MIPLVVGPAETHILAGPAAGTDLRTAAVSQEVARTAAVRNQGEVPAEERMSP